MNRYRILSIVTAFCLVFSMSCNESEILEEVPLSFANPNNSYVTLSDFNAGVYAMYDRLRATLSAGEHRPLDYLYGTDIGYNGAQQLNQRFGSYTATLTVISGQAEYHWRQYYKIISNANIILAFLPDSELTAEQQLKIEAEAKLFRGLSYRNLGYLYGGVPITLEAIAEPKVDFVRAPRQEVYEQAVADLKFAAENLAGINDVQDGQVSDLAAYHLLAETYVALERWDEAIAAATVVINDPNTALMTERFGSRMTEPGDVYWDLFRRQNQNRGSGNTEGIWVFQQELDVPGGVILTSDNEGAQLERDHAPRPYTFAVKDPSGKAAFLSLGVSYTTGRGIGRLSPTNHLKYGIWHSDWNDMRNSEYNMIRDVMFNNPESEWYGQMLSSRRELFRKSNDDTIRNFYPFQAKVFTPGNHPPELYIDPELQTLNASAAGTTYTDQYFIRLAETYLLRAEAYMGKNDLANAAADINVVRGRAQAIPVTEGEIDIDYILDERMRELGVEEKRRLTLNRLGLLYDRTSRYCEGNPVAANFGCDVEPYHNLFPIPFRDIEVNTDAVLEQNPGYTAP